MKRVLLLLLILSSATIDALEEKTVYKKISFKKIRRFVTQLPHFPSLSQESDEESDEDWSSEVSDELEERLYAGLNSYHTEAYDLIILCNLVERVGWETAPENVSYLEGTRHLYAYLHSLREVFKEDPNEFFNKLFYNLRDHIREALTRLEMSDDDRRSCELSMISHARDRLFAAFEFMKKTGLILYMPRLAFDY